MRVGSLVKLSDSIIPATEAERESTKIARGYRYVWPEKNEIYTVREVRSKSILLEEIVNPPMPLKGDKMQEAGFRTCDFIEIQPPMDLTELLKVEEPKVKITRII